MAAPLHTGKQSVNLAAMPRESRIRRDPPRVAEKLDLRDPEEVERRNVIVGIGAFALAIFVIVLALGMSDGWSLSEYTIRVRM